MTSKSTDAMATDDRYLKHLGMMVAEAYAELKAKDEQADASYPKVIPACPSWCAYEPGHAYESTLFDLVTHTRYHESAPKGDVTISQEERNKGGVVEQVPVVLQLWGVDRPEDLDAAKARALAADLLAGAARLDEITGGQR